MDGITIDLTIYDNAMSGALWLDMMDVVEGCYWPSLCEVQIVLYIQDNQPLIDSLLAADGREQAEILARYLAGISDTYGYYEVYDSIMCIDMIDTL